MVWGSFALGSGLLRYYARQSNYQALSRRRPCCWAELLSICYFFFFTFFGDKGLITFFSLKREVSNIEITKQEFINKMENRKNMVGGMSSDSLDLDLLDEQSRRVLGYVGKNEVVIYQDKKEQGHESAK